MNILITGHKGFIGSNMMKFMEEKNHNVIGFEWDDNSEHYPNLDGVDRVIHLGAETSTICDDIDLIMKKNYDFSCKLLEDCAYLKIPFQYASSASVYGNTKQVMSEQSTLRPLNYYAYSKYMFERFALDFEKDAETPIQGFRYFNVFGKGEEHKGSQASPITVFRKQALDNKNIKVFKNSNLYERDFVYVGDICELHHRMFNINESGIWNAGTGSPTSFLEIAVIMAHKYDVNIDYIEMPGVIRKQYQHYTKADLKKLNNTVKMNWFPIQDYINYEL